MSSRQDSNDSVTVEEPEEYNRLHAEEETFYIQSDTEYDEIFGRVILSVVDEVDIEGGAFRLIGPSGCGKTTLARSLAIDVEIADEVINNYGVPVWNMSADELAVLASVSEEVGEEEGEERCPGCGSKKSFYKRTSKSPTYACTNHEDLYEFEEPVRPDDRDPYDVFEDLDIEEELENRGLVTKDGSRTDSYPNSRAESIRQIYEFYEDDALPESKPFYEVTLSHDKYAKDLIASPIIDGDSVVVELGEVTKALSATNDDTTILALDEVNRATTDVKDGLYKAISGQVEADFNEVGNVKIKGDSENFFVISTMNSGFGYNVEPIDFAEKRRLEAVKETDYLGTNHPKREAKLIVEETPDAVGYDLAIQLVETANEIREMAKDEDTDVDRGVPTGTMLVWASNAYSNHLAGIDQPVVTAGVSSVAKGLFDQDERAQKAIRTTISTNLHSVRFFDKNDESSSKASEPMYKCQDTNNQQCSWSARASEVTDKHKMTYICPECGGQTSKVYPGELS